MPASLVDLAARASSRDWRAVFSCTAGAFVVAKVAPDADPASSFAGRQPVGSS